MSNQEGSQVYNIIAFVFADRETAKQVSDELKVSAKDSGYKVVANAVVEVDEKGKAHVHEAGHGGWGAAVGAGTLGLLSLIGGPAGLLVWAVAGGVIGGVAGKLGGRAIPKKDLEALAAQMQPNSSAILAIVEDKESEALIDSMSPYNVNVVTLTLGDEVSGEIAQAVQVDAEIPVQMSAVAVSAPASEDSSETDSADAAATPAADEGNPA